MDCNSWRAKGPSDLRNESEMMSGPAVIFLITYRPWMTFHIFRPSDFDIASWRRSFQLSILALLIASVASWQAPIHSCWFWWIVWQRQFRVRILVCTYGVIQGLNFFLGFVFLTCIVAAEFRMSSKQDIFILSWRLFIFDSTSFVKHDQSTSLRRHLATLRTTGR